MLSEIKTMKVEGSSGFMCCRVIPLKNEFINKDMKIKKQVKT